MNFEKLQGSGLEVTYTNYHLSILINRSESLNALSFSLLSGLVDIFTEIKAQSENYLLKLVSISGSGKRAFVAGADLKEISLYSTAELNSYIECGYQALRLIAECPVPVLALVNGVALGGGLELALACDLIIAVEDAKFGFPEINLGLIPGLGGTVRSLNRVSLATVKKLTLLGENISATNAKELGLVDEIVPRDNFADFSSTFVEKLLAKPLHSLLALKKQFISESLNISVLRSEVELFKSVFENPNAKEGISAFLEKREPRFNDSKAG
jgi:enoyl-CoA hydratase